MKPTAINRFRIAPALVLPLISLHFTTSAAAADRWWDGGTADIATNGDGASGNATGQALAGTWNSTLANWDQGAGLAHAAWNNANLDTAVFGGVHANTIRIITIGANLTVQQIKIATGSTGNFRYDIGASASQNDFAISFGGTYGDAMPQVDASGAGNNNFPAKVIGDYTTSGGMFVTHGSNITTPGASGRFAFTNTNNAFVGDLVMLSGNLSIGTQMGAPANKLILKGGSLFISSGAAVTSTFARDIHVAAASGLSTNATVSGTQAMDLTGKLTGAANLTRYSSVAGTSVSEVRFSGDMSGFSGVFENTGVSANALVTVQTTATSGGSWKINGGTLKLNAANNNAIGSFSDAVSNPSPLLLNATLDMNGKSETINGLAGTATAGVVQNALNGTTATLTLGDGDATATFAGSLRDNAGGTATGKLALTKIGAGTQTIGGAATHSGATAVNAGTLVLGTTGTTPAAASAVTVAPSATLGIKRNDLDQSLTLDSLATGTGSGSTLTFDCRGFGLSATNTMLNCLTTLNPGSGATTVIKLKGYDFYTGTFPLIGYGTIGEAGFAGFAKQLPYRMAATLVHNTTDPLKPTIDLNITSAETAVWKGEVGGVANGTWDVDPDGAGTEGTLNWKTSVSGTATRYAQGPINTDQVTFGDDLSPTGTSTVNLTTTLTPRHTRVNNSTVNYTFVGAGRLSGESMLEKDGTGTLILANTSVNDHTGGTLIHNGTLQLGDGVTAGAGRILGTIANSGDLAFNHPEAVTCDNILTGSGGRVVKLGTNTLTLTAANTYGSGTMISKGTLAAAGNAALGAGTVTLGDANTAADPVALVLDNRVDITNPVTVSANGTGTATLAASNTGTGTGNPATFGGTLTLDRATTLRNDIPGERLIISGRITSTPPEPPETALPPVAITVTGGQNVSLQSASNDFNGSISVTGAGTVLQTGSGTASEVIPNAVSVDLATGTVLKLAANANLTETIAALTGTGGVERAATGLQTLAIGSGDISCTFGGVLANGPGVVALTKIGTGTLTLTGANTATGSTTVAGGTLAVNGSIASLSLVTGGTLAGGGTVGAITATGSGRVSPATDTTIGTLTAIGNVSFATGTEFTVQINSDGTPACDRLEVTGNLTLGSDVAALNATDLGGTALAATTKLVLATASGTITGTFKDPLGNPLPNNSNLAIGPNTFKLRYDDTVGALNAVTLTHTVGGGYDSWASTNGVGAADADADSDGLANGVEYVLGSNPKAAGASGITTTTTATEFVFTFSRSDASETPDTAVWIETSNDLVSWNADASPYQIGATTATSATGVTVVENDANPDTITLTVPRNTAAKFARLKVTVTP